MSVDITREPCPNRIIEDLGGAFGMGCIGGFLWNFGKNLRNFPRGERFSGAFYIARRHAPILGGNFAVWGGTFSSFDCLFQAIRHKDDPWNAIFSGAATGGTLALRGGWNTVWKQAAMGGILLAVIEGVMIVFSRKAIQSPRDQYQQVIAHQQQEKSSHQNKAK